MTARAPYRPKPPAIQAIEFALSICCEIERCRFLRAFLRGDTSEWQRFQPTITRRAATAALRAAHSASDEAVERHINTES